MGFAALYPSYDPSWSLHVGQLTERRRRCGVRSRGLHREAAMTHGGSLWYDDRSHGSETVARVFIADAWQQVVGFSQLDDQLDRMRDACDGSGPGFIGNANAVRTRGKFDGGILIGRQRSERLAIDLNRQRKNAGVTPKRTTDVHRRVARPRRSRDGSRCGRLIWHR